MCYDYFSVEDILFLILSNYIFTSLYILIMQYGFYCCLYIFCYFVPLLLNIAHHSFISPKHLFLCSLYNYFL